MRRFLIDNQLPGSAARWLETKGCGAEHVLDLGLAQVDDKTIWAHAVSVGAVIVTKDEDFAQMVPLRTEPVAVVWLRIGNCRTEALLAALDRAWPEILLRLDAGERLIEVH